jgi:soluble lytic murein transglycosylase-like protein
VGSLDFLRLLAAAALLAAASPSAAQGVRAWNAPIAEASARFGVPVTWIRRVMQVESAGQTLRGGRPIRSRVGAMGLMQLMPGTWQAMRRAHGLGADPDDPRDNILAGAAYLRAMYDRFGYPGLFTAYNAGPARYEEYLAGGRTLPAETVEYLGRVVGLDRGAASIPSARPPAFGSARSAPDGTQFPVGSGLPDGLSNGRPGVFFDLGSQPR